MNWPKVGLPSTSVNDDNTPYGLLKARVRCRVTETAISARPSDASRARTARTGSLRRLPPHRSAPAELAAREKDPEPTPGGRREDCRRTMPVLRTKAQP